MRMVVKLAGALLDDAATVDLIAKQVADLSAQGHEILVVHDELDLPPGTVKLKKGGGTGGHNGVTDVAACLGSKDFWRLRIGIGHPGVRDAVIDYVLCPPRPEERAPIEAAATPPTAPAATFMTSRRLMPADIRRCFMISNCSCWLGDFF